MENVWNEFFCNWISMSPYIGLHIPLCWFCLIDISWNGFLTCYFFGGSVPYNVTKCRLKRLSLSFFTRYPLHFLWNLIFLGLIHLCHRHCNSHLCSFTNIEEVVHCYYPGHMTQDELTMLVEYFFDSIYFLLDQRTYLREVSCSCICGSMGLFTYSTSACFFSWSSLINISMVSCSKGQNSDI